MNLSTHFLAFKISKEEVPGIQSYLNYEIISISTAAPSYQRFTISGHVRRMEVRKVGGKQMAKNIPCNDY